MANRKDPRGRTLKSGEVYRKDGRYVFRYTAITFDTSHLKCEY